MSMPRDEQGQPEVNPDDENADLGSDGSGEVDLDPDDDSEADYEPQPTAGDDPKTDSKAQRDSDR
ncbi:hypothetical protein [Citricoccus sp.]|uniref:hypothetical protein n=1 Tax=Citricoccus sp. TaxID=1978372 RepID=UPI0028BD4156|nr:hypothetical protein [Citricoccus sp.]